MALESMEDKFTKYEMARILGARALQLAMDAPILLKLDEKQLDDINYDVLKMAELEFEGEVLPITVKRPFPEKAQEKIKKLSKEEIKQLEEKKEIAKIQEEKRKEAEDRKIEKKGKEEVEDIKEAGEIMELAQPSDEREEGETKEQGI